MYKMPIEKRIFHECEKCLYIGECQIWKVRQYEVERLSEELSKGLPKKMQAEVNLVITNCPRFESE